MRVRLRDALAALRAFLRGFTGLAPLPHDEHGARCALEHRASQRKTCC